MRPATERSSTGRERRTRTWTACIPPPLADSCPQHSTGGRDRGGLRADLLHRFTQPSPCPASSSYVRRAHCPAMLRLDRGCTVMRSRSVSTTGIRSTGASRWIMDDADWSSISAYHTAAPAGYETRCAVMQPFAVRHFRLVLFLGGIGVLILSVVHVGVGTVALTPIEVIAALVGQPYESFHRVIVWDLRLPRTLIALLVGGMFGLAGAILQSIMRNPLAEPEMTGATSGAVLLAVLWQTWTAGQPEQLGVVLPLIALIGGPAAGGVVYLVSWQRPSGSIPLIFTRGMLRAVLCSARSRVLLI